MEGLQQFLTKHELTLNLNGVQKEFFCLYCKNLLERPVVSNCGCHFCDNCIKTYLGKASKKCPNCTSKIKYDVDVKNDYDLGIEMNKVRINCPNASCSREVSLTSVLTHLRVCIKDKIFDDVINAVRNREPRKRRSNGQYRHIIAKAIKSKKQEEISYEEFTENLVKEDKVKEAIVEPVIPKALSLEEMNKTFFREIFQLRCILESKYDKEINVMKTRLKEAELRNKDLSDKVETLKNQSYRFHMNLNEEKQKCAELHRKMNTGMDVVKTRIDALENQTKPEKIELPKIPIQVVTNKPPPPKPKPIKKPVKKKEVVNKVIPPKKNPEYAAAPSEPNSPIIKPAGQPLQECLCSFTEMTKKRNGDTTVYYSEAFQICGYSMKVGIRYYNDNGMIVVGLCLLNNPNDAQLQWPIPYTFSLAVLDQAGIEFKVKNFGVKTTEHVSHYERMIGEDRSCYLEESQIHVWDKSVTINDCVFIKCSFYL